MGKIAGLGIAVLVAAVAGAVVYAGKATVTVRLPVQPVSLDVTVTGGRDSGYFPTRQVTLNLSETMRWPASPAEAGTYATGQVTFVHYSDCTQLCYGEYMLPAGYEVLSTTGVAYRTLAEVHWKPGTISAPVGIRAEVPGPAGNSGPHTIVQTRLWPGWMVPDNATAITGGISRLTHKVSRSDVDTALSSLYARLQSEVQGAMVLNAGVLVFAEDGLPVYTYALDHAIGDETPWFTAWMTATLSANGFSDRQARSLIAGALPAHVGAVQAAYSIESMSSDGDVRLRGTASAFTVQSADPATWQRRLASMSVDQARTELLRAFPGAQVDIRTWGSPLLPAAPGRISVVFEPLPSYRA